MKIAVVFILAALCSSYDAAAVSEPNCLVQLFQEDAPLLLQNLVTLLCDYKVAQKSQNAALFQAFLQQVNALLGKVGCTIDNILGTKVTVTLQNAEAIGDDVAIVLFGYLDGIIAKVVKIVNEIPFLDDIVNDQNLITSLQNTACGVMEAVIADVDKVLKFVANIAANLAQKP